MIIQLNKISPRANKKDIRNLFSTYGVVSGVIKSPNSAFIRMPDDDRAAIAIQNLDGMKWKGWNIRVKPLSSKTETPVCRTSIGVLRMF
ncbi:RNA-binding protein [Paracrocinitomix mangrovi]|uniref:RNA recognition motif domain-containing protein n=1 Tax=Paracrocinitomix mangrovi TaxID=2862509 RepID=UPI001C8D03DD|nr:RNA-binding protein [Paracrocinitomix mangrovi]UKN00271.1 RNA-binding protein [Paracrocinitomix mangrovi]